MFGNDLLSGKGSLGKDGISNFREKRFTLEDPLTALLLPNYHGVFGFWFNVKNISKSGILVHSIFDSLSPLKDGDVVSVTLDMHSKFFERPIQMDLRIAREAKEVLEVIDPEKVKRESYKETRIAQSFGLSIERMSDRDLEIFRKGLQKLEESRKAASAEVTQKAS